MNINAFKNLLLGSGLLAIAGPYLLNLLMAMFGCVGDDPLTAAIEVAQCTGGDLFTIPVGLQKLIGGLVIAGALALPGFFKTGTFMQNLFSPSVPMVPDADAKPGVVTAKQVSSEKP